MIQDINENVFIHFIYHSFHKCSFSLLGPLVLRTLCLQQEQVDGLWSRPALRRSLPLLQPQAAGRALCRIQFNLCQEEFLFKYFNA